MRILTTLFTFSLCWLASAATVYFPINNGRLTSPLDGATYAITNAGLLQGWLSSTNILGAGASNGMVLMWNSSSSNSGWAALSFPTNAPSNEEVTNIAVYVTDVGTNTLGTDLSALIATKANTNSPNIWAPTIHGGATVNGNLTVGGGAYFLIPPVGDGSSLTNIARDIPTAGTAVTIVTNAGSPNNTYAISVNASDLNVDDVNWSTNIAHTIGDTFDVMFIPIGTNQAVSFDLSVLALGEDMDVVTGGRFAGFWTRKGGADATDPGPTTGYIWGQSLSGGSVGCAYATNYLKIQGVFNAETNVTWKVKGRTITIDKP